ncbi:BCCT family transporter [Deinococcus piscis]|uniref:BCCT family transporter n=1 Tax=Deinococcus piscis TaxID=394230 RepID=A0ABQ3KBI1_9DEIO|nr:BCCT family transporter [Deinococcus piscis]GHG11627.1 BCCT family transporter [Deinococcus piscis]
MVFRTALIIIALFLAWGLTSPAGLEAASSAALASITTNFGWFYLLSGLAFLVFCLYLAFSRFGQIPLGQDGEEPEFSTSSWFAMLFSAGMGIGLVFWGAAEPMSHFTAPPERLEPGSVEAARAAMRYSFFHWGLHPWAIYSVVALSIAYFSFRKGEKTLVSRTFRPLLGKAVEGPAGMAIDLLAIFATVFGVATSLGLGALQINSGLNSVFGLPIGTPAQLGIIAAVTVLFMISASTALDKGIQLLSNLNLGLAGLLLLLTFIFGPSVFLLDTFTTTVGSYIQNLIGMSTRLTPFSGDSWVGGWTIFYWAWWIAWAPFVGLFIARISRGRTIKEFILGVLLVPALVSFLWFSVFGGSALYTELFGVGGLAAVTAEDTSKTLFALFDTLPLGSILSMVATALIASFFVTSADSATFVLGMQSRDGNENPDTRTKLIWGAIQSLIAVALLVSGGLSGLQSATIVAALPFSIIMLGMCISLYRALSHDSGAAPQRPLQAKAQAERAAQTVTEAS